MLAQLSWSEHHGGAKTESPILFRNVRLAAGPFEETERSPDDDWPFGAPRELGVDDGPVAAARAARLTASKISIERPLLIMVSPESRLLTLKPNEDQWNRLASKVEATTLSDESLRVMRSKLPAGLDDKSFDVTRRSLESQIALDTVLNEYLLRQKIRTWFADGEVQDLDSLNERIYAELFLTPSSDPWLGLGGENTYLALPIED